MYHSGSEESDLVSLYKHAKGNSDFILFNFSEPNLAGRLSALNKEEGLGLQENVGY